MNDERAEIAELQKELRQTKERLQVLQTCLEEGSHTLSVDIGGCLKGIATSTAILVEDDSEHVEDLGNGFLHMAGDISCQARALWRSGTVVRHNKETSCARTAMRMIGPGTPATIPPA